VKLAFNLSTRQTAKELTHCLAGAASRSLPFTYLVAFWHLSFAPEQPREAHD